MRLTLRTLLAYLDNTLEPQDAEILRAKLEQSGFATQLVQNIRASLSAKSISAPAPDSVHPVEEPNMISDYLDSTLTAEQVAEVEKVCLESLPHLAEAAACHQILTMVLGRSAEVSDELRNRVYSMVDEKGNVLVDAQTARTAGFQVPHQPETEPAATGPIAGEIGPRFSDVNVVDPSQEAPSNPMAQDEQPTISLTEAAAMGVTAAGGEFSAPEKSVSDGVPGHRTGPTPPGNVQPVGADDSGVFMAASKLKEQSEHFAEAGAAMDDAAPFAGSRPLKDLERSDFYEGEVRASRITPWLVSLALVGALLFAVAQIFSPLLQPDVVAKEEEKMSEVYPDIEVSTDESQATESAQDDEIVTPPPTDSEDQTTTRNADSQPETPSSKETDADPQGALAEESVAAAGDESRGATEPKPEDAEMLAEASSDSGSSDPVPNDPVASDPVPSDPLPSDPIATGTSTKKPDDESGDAAEVKVAMLPEASEAPPKPPMKDPSVPDVEETPRVEVASLVSEDAFVATKQGDGQWVLVSPEGKIHSDDLIACGPEYRADLALVSGQPRTLTLVGPTQVQVDSVSDSAIDVGLKFGRIVVRLPSADDQVMLRIGDSELQLVANRPDTTLALAVQHSRLIGDDPMVPENHQTELLITGLSGTASFENEGNTLECNANDQHSFSYSGDKLVYGEVQSLENPPAWTDPESDISTFESDAASDLLALIRDDQSDTLMLALRVALGFRRNEVAALAGKVMLTMDDATAYFGVDGLLSKPRQRLYWAAHLQSLRAMIDRGVEETESVRRAIAGHNIGMQAAEEDAILRLLVGYSQDQLKTGGDAELVEDLESGSVPVRVLASEHLREISGTTLFFKPEETVAARREEVVKKWKVRLGKESIRWPEAN